MVRCRASRQIALICLGGGQRGELVEFRGGHPADEQVDVVEPDQAIAAGVRDAVDVVGRIGVPGAMDAGEEQRIDGRERARIGSERGQAERRVPQVPRSSRVLARICELLIRQWTSR